MEPIIVVEDDDDMISSDDEEDTPPPTHIVTVDEMLSAGLRLRYKTDRITRATRNTNMDRFNENYNCYPITACSLYELLQTTTIKEARIANASPTTLEHFLIALYFLFRYPTREGMEAAFDKSKGYVSKKAWDMIGRIAALKKEVIVWPENPSVGTWGISVDGTHIWKQEKKHEELSQDPGEGSHKLKHAAKTFEFGISLTGGIVWINGPYRAGMNDLNVFRLPGGLKEKLTETGMRAIGDNGYRGEPDLVSTPNNAHDSKPVRRFKSRARLRHETCNRMTKVFEIIQAGRFRHSETKLKKAVEAICVICNIKIEHEMPLFDILVPSVVDADKDDACYETEIESASDEEEEEEEDENESKEEDNSQQRKRQRTS
jgi:transcription elongation factor Elf1